jgi:energy-coupling factor transporter ATP-binding protein EcfA2
MDAGALAAEAAAFTRSTDEGRPAAAPTPALRILAEMGEAGTFSRPLPEPPAHGLRPLRMLTLDECAAAPHRGYLVKGWIAPGDLVVMFGPPGAGKSVLAPYMAHAIAAGRSIFGRRVRSGPVLYVAAEDGAGMKMRATALRAVHGDAAGLRIVAEPVDLMGDGVTEPDDTGNGAPPDVARILAAAERIGAALIVIDTLARAFPGLDENDGRSMGRAVRILRAMCSPRRAVLAVHHGAKAGSSGGSGGGTPRGHGVLNGDADVTIRIDVPEDATAPRTIHLGKNRNGTTIGSMAFAIRGHALGTDEDGDPITAPVAEEAAEDAHAPAVDPRQRAEARLNDAAALLLRELRSLAADAPLAVPEPGMPKVRAVERSQLRARLIQSGWFTAEELRQGVPEDGNALLSITRAAQRREGKALDALKRKGFAGFTSQQAWPA